mgnify:CR=1 FL=1
MDIYICIGSSCHLKGSRSVIDGVCVRVGEKTVTGVNAENFDEKFETEILGELRDE